MLLYNQIDVNYSLNWKTYSIQMSKENFINVIFLHLSCDSSPRPPCEKKFHLCVRDWMIQETDAAHHLTSLGHFITKNNKTSELFSVSVMASPDVGRITVNLFALGHFTPRLDTDNLEHVTMSLSPQARSWPPSPCRPP